MDKAKLNENLASTIREAGWMTRIHSYMIFTIAFILVVLIAWANANYYFLILPSIIFIIGTIFWNLGHEIEDKPKAEQKKNIILLIFLSLLLFLMGGTLLFIMEFWYLGTALSAINKQTLNGIQHI